MKKTVIFCPHCGGVIIQKWTENRERYAQNPNLPNRGGDVYGRNYRDLKRIYLECEECGHIF